MTDSADQTPIERPLTRADLNEIRGIVHRISERQLIGLKQQEAFQGDVLALTTRMTSVERRLWLPTAISAALAVLAALARLVP